MTGDELKPCPFCGGENICHSSWDIRCYDCKATMPGEPDKAASRWNGRALTAALEAEQPVAVAIKPLEWREEPVPPTGEALAYSSVGLYCIPLGSARLPLKFRDKVILGVFDTLEAAKATAQQDYETRIKSAIVEVPVAIPANLVERCAEIFEWKETGILTGDKLRAQASAIREKFNSVFDAGEALRQAEEETKRQAFAFAMLSSTRTASSADGSATAATGTGGGSCD